MIFIATCINLYYIYLGSHTTVRGLNEETAPNLVVIDN